MFLFRDNECIDIYLKNTNQYVRYAVEDLIKDFNRVSENSLKPRYITEENEWCLVIEENSNDCDCPIFDESYSIKRDGNIIRIIAKTYLGTMWGIYTFCEQILGVDPCFLFNDCEIEKKRTLEIGEINIDDKPKNYGFRGLFINDEDLLTGWKESLGVRKVDYMYYHTTVAPNAMDEVVETALRLKFNLIIPASLLDIGNPSEKALVDCVAKRGIFVSQHHIEPLGVSHFTLENYYNRYDNFSYAKNPDLFKEIWQCYATKWAEYDNVIWQIGLRGKGDKAIWDGKPTDEELEIYAQIISESMSEQIKIVENTTKKKKNYFTTTLWSEGSILFEKNLLEVSDNTVIIFSDTGPNQMFGEDYYVVPRRKDYNYGIYYHLQYFADGPHLAPQTGIDKLYYNLKKADENGDTSYSIINVSNIREFVFEMNACGKILWDINKFEKEEYLDKCFNKYGKYANEMKRIINSYFLELPELDISCLEKHYRQFFNYDFADAPKEIKNFVLKDGAIVEYGATVISNFRKKYSGDLCEDFYYEIKKVIPKYEKMLIALNNIVGLMPENLRKHTEAKWTLFIDTLLGIYKWYVNLYEAREFYHKGANYIKIK